MQPPVHGNIDQSALGRKNDYLYRVSLKGMVFNNQGEVLVVKETGRDWWDLPGGGMDHEESLKAAIARELKEEVELEGEFTYCVVAVDDPIYLPNANVWQVRLIFEVTAENMKFSPGEDGDEIAFKHPAEFKHSSNFAERKIFDYYSAIS
ncbi:MAG: 8-oxo-dGTP diphosphatase [Patescibacteria group bacterium]|nr:8-oxo-dGTP diphosphatase [Patescibacteria group bacterium]